MFKFLVLLLLVSCSTTYVPQSYTWDAASKHGLELTLFGTIHQDLGELSDSLKQAIDKADVVYIESSKENSKKIFTDLFQDILYGADEKNNLRNTLSKKANKNIQKLFSNEDFKNSVKKHTGGKDIEALSPQLLTLVLASIPSEKWVKYLPAYSLNKMEGFVKRHPKAIRKINESQQTYQNTIDSKIEEYALSQNKKIVSLDSTRSTRKIIEGLTLLGHENSIRYLEFIFGDGADLINDNVIKNIEAKDRLVAAYRNGDDATVKAESLIIEKSTYSDDLLKNRNVSWINKIELGADVKKNPQQNLFVAVGIAHFYGQYSILEMLKANGYKVARITK